MKLKKFREGDRIQILDGGYGEIISVIDNEMHILWDEDELEEHLQRRMIYPISGFVANHSIRLIYHEDEKIENELKYDMKVIYDNSYMIIQFPKKSTHIQVSTNCVGFKNKNKFNYISSDSNGFYHAVIMLGIKRFVIKELDENEISELKLLYKQDFIPEQTKVWLMM